MKNMKYLILFEKFKSSKLSKTLGFIQDASVFLRQIKGIAKIYDYPASELSDDMFEYLPFKQALAVNRPISTGKKTCQAESPWIPGEKCDNGKIKRTWGKGFRTVVCDACGGTGIEKEKTTADLYCLKFWFDKDGKFITTTGSDGTSEVVKKEIFDGYEELVTYTNEADFRACRPKTGDMFKMIKHSRSILGTIFEEAGYYYFIHNNDGSCHGSSPGNRDFKKYGGYSWSLEGFDCTSLTSLIPKSDIPTEKLYNSNYITEIGRSITLSKKYDSSSIIADAHFAIILYMDYLTKATYKKVDITRKERVALKAGASKLIKNEDIKRENIERYIKELSTKFNVLEGLSGITKVLPRLMGGKKNCVYYIFIGRNIGTFNSIIEMVAKFIKLKGDDISVINEKETISRYIINYVTDAFKDSVVVNRNTEKNIDKIMSRLVVADVDRPKTLQVIVEMGKLSELIYEKIIKCEIETIEDMESVLYKLESIRTLFRRDRYTIRFLSGYIDYLNYDDERHSFARLIDNFRESRADDILNDIKIIGNIINKM
jgi:hypothetical protein